LNELITAVQPDIFLVDMVPWSSEMYFMSTEGPLDGDLELPQVAFAHGLLGCPGHDVLMR